MDNSARWSVCTKKWCPSKQCLKCSSAHTTPSNSSSLILYFFSALFRNRDAYDIVSHPLHVSCSSTASRNDREASVLTLVFLLT